MNRQATGENGKGRDAPSADSLLKWLQWAELGGLNLGAESFFWVSQTIMSELNCK